MRSQHRACFAVVLWGLSGLIVAAAAGAREASGPAQAPVQPPLAPPAAPAPQLLPVPHPDLEPLEAQVADQIREYQDLTEETLDDPDSTPEKRSGAFGEMGRIYHTYGLTAAAEACYLNAISLAPQQAKWPYYLGLLRQTEGRFDTAAEAFRRSLELDPAYPPTFYRLAEIELELGHTDEAESQLVRYLDLEPEAAAGWALRGQMALSRKDYPHAVEYLERALELLPRANRLHVPLALAYRELGDTEKARQHLAERGSIGARPDDPRVDQLEELKQGERVHLIRGRMAFKAGDLSGAVREFGKAVDANGESVPARIDLAAALAQTGDLPDAETQLRRAIELDPKNGTAHYNLGALLIQQGETEEARRHLGKAIELDPADAAAHLDLGHLLLTSGDPAAALPHLQQAIENGRDSEQARLDQAAARVALGRYPEAKKGLEEANRAAPQSGRIARELARLLATAPDPELRDGERALDLAQRVLDAQKTVSNAELVAASLAELGRCDEAAKLQEQVLESVRSQGATELEPRLAADLERYRKGPPCRPPFGSDSPSPDPSGSDSGSTSARD